MVAWLTGWVPAWPHTPERLGQARPRSLTFNHESSPSGRSSAAMRRGQGQA